MKFFKIIKKPNKEKEKEFNENMKSENLDKHDKFSMILSAIITLFLPSVLILCGICLLAMWIFGAL